MRSTVHLRVIRNEPDEEGGPRQGARSEPAVPDTGDLVLVALLFFLNLVPVASDLAGLGRWSPAVVGFAAGATVLTGRELWSQLRERLGAKTDQPGDP
jgi:hypothetical protein